MKTPYLNEMIQELEGYTGANNSYLSKQGIKKLNELKAIKEQLLSNRRELLIAFHAYIDETQGFAPKPFNERRVDEFIKSNL